MEREAKGKLRTGTRGAPTRLSARRERALPDALAYPPSAEEIARRRALFSEVMASRAEMEPLDVHVDELIRMGREGDSPVYG